MKPIVITMGRAFCDIDALACAVAYKEFLEKTGQSAVVFIPGILNYSTGYWGKKLEKEITTVFPKETEQIVVVDVSDPDKFHPEVTTEKVVEIFDHHSGFEKFWNERLGQKSHIETIGACATLIWEEFTKVGLEKTISRTSAELMAAAIVENTSNLDPNIAIPRDFTAIENLQKQATLPDDWRKKYYTACENNILNDVESALRGDTKIEKIPERERLIIIGQLELWQPKDLLKNHRQQIETILKSFGSPHWMLNLLNISEKKNTILTNDPETQNFLQNNFEVTFKNGLAETDKMILRKKILKTLQENGWN